MGWDPVLGDDGIWVHAGGFARTRSEKREARSEGPAWGSALEATLLASRFSPYGAFLSHPWTNDPTPAPISAPPAPPIAMP